MIWRSHSLELVCASVARVTGKRGEELHTAPPPPQRYRGFLAVFGIFSRLESASRVAWPVREEVLSVSILESPRPTAAVQDMSRADKE